MDLSRPKLTDKEIKAYKLSKHERYFILRLGSMHRASGKDGYTVFPVASWDTVSRAWIMHWRYEDEDTSEEISEDVLYNLSFKRLIFVPNIDNERGSDVCKVRLTKQGWDLHDTIEEIDKRGQYQEPDPFLRFKHIKF